MIVDDRLATVLETPAGGRQALATQWCQIVDILGRADAESETPVRRAARDRLGPLHESLGDAPAARALGPVRLRAPALVAQLAALGPRTALAAIGAARLDEAQWLALIPQLPIHARGALRHRRDLSTAVTALLDRLGIEDFVLPCPEPAADNAAEAEAPRETATPEATTVIPLRIEPARRSEAPAGGASVGAIVRRIAEFRRGRETEPGQVRLPLGDESGAESVATTLDLVLDAAGTITAAEGAEAGLLVGHRPFGPAGPASVAHADAATLAAARARRPISGGSVHFAGPPRIAGAWRIDALPLFSREGGRFSGYCAHLSRVAAPAADDAQAVQRAGAEALHQLLHELRTPINAIQGFAELIQQQMLGPTPHQYRSIAAAIASDAARMLAAFEDVERLVGLESGRLMPDAGEVDCTTLVERMIAQIAPLAAPREIRLRSSTPGHPIAVSLAESELERTLWRLLSALIAAAAPGERLAVMLDCTREAPQCARLSVTLPDSLARHAGSAMGGDVARLVGSGPAMLGPGFALRLCEAELAAAGGALQRLGGEARPSLALMLPLAAPLALDRSGIAS